jgi:RNA polymerase sigma factor (sigma-70 family)
MKAKVISETRQVSEEKAKEVLGEEMFSLFKRLRSGNVTKEEKRILIGEIIKKNMGLVYSTAGSYWGLNKDAAIDFDDLIQEGMLGLERAIQTFDYLRGVKYSTYATNWVRQKMFRLIYDNGTIRVPIGTQLKISLMLKKTEELLFRNVKVGEEVVRRSLGWPEERFKRVVKAIGPRDIIHLDDMVRSKRIKREKPNKMVWVDLLADSSIYKPEKKSALFRIIILLVKKNPKISARNLHCFKQYYFGDRRTLQDIGDEFGLSRERIRQTNEKIIQYLRENKRVIREFLVNDILPDFLSEPPDETPRDNALADMAKDCVQNDDSTG